MAIQIFGFTLPDLTIQQYIWLIVALAIYFYVFVNYLIRKVYIRAAYYDDGDGFDIYPCKIIGSSIEFYPEKIKKFYGIIPLQRRQHTDPVRKDIAAGAKSWVRGPRTFKLYVCTYNSPTTINPTERELEEYGLSLGHEAIKGVIREVALGARMSSRKDFLTYALFLIAGMALHMILQKFIPALAP